MAALAALVIGTAPEVAGVPGGILVTEVLGAIIALREMLALVVAGVVVAGLTPVPVAGVVVAGQVF